MVQIMDRRTYLSSTVLRSPVVLRSQQNLERLPVQLKSKRSRTACYLFENENLFGRAMIII